MKYALSILILLASSIALSLEPLGEAELDSVLGQGGVYLTGDIAINSTGGPLNKTNDASNPAIWKVNCSEVSTDKKCGARLAVNAGDDSNNGWLVLDNIRGRFSFEGLTLKTRAINSGFDGDGASFDKSVLEVGLPSSVKYTNVSFTLANSNKAQLGTAASGFRQTNILDAKINGNVKMGGNLLLFPTGTP